MKNKSFFFSLAVIFLLVSCWPQPPILIGFAGQLSGKQSELGTQGRDGALLAVETINANGGVNGRRLQMLVEDDLGTPEGAAAVDQTLIEKKVVVIIGHMTSNATLGGLKVTEPAKMIMFSPTTSSSELTGLDDYFLRVQSDTGMMGRVMAEYAYSEDHLRTVACIYDIDNAAYTTSYLREFERVFTALGGKMTASVRFSAASNPTFSTYLPELRQDNPQALMIMASGLHTALIAQSVRMDGWQTPLIGVGWAMGNTLVENGGKAVEGMKISQTYDPQSKNPAMIDFQTRFKERFGHDPIFAATQSYETVLVLAAALEKTGGSSTGLREALLQIRNFPGLQGNLTMDPYGDVLRTNFILVVQDGQFVPIKQVDPEQP